MDGNGLSRILGIDYGGRRIGLALSDPLGIIAKPLTVIDRQITEDYFSVILQIAEENKTDAIVVGVPYTMKGQISKQTVLVQEFMEQLKIISAIPVKGIDERLTSVAAKKALHQQGVKTGHEKMRIDETAAAILLQEYLDSQY